MHGAFGIELMRARQHDIDRSVERTRGTRRTQARPGRARASWRPGLGADAVRLTFGIVWLVDASLKWLPGFRTSLVSTMQEAADGQPSWLHGWFSFWVNLIAPRASLFTPRPRDKYDKLEHRLKKAMEDVVKVKEEAEAEIEELKHSAKEARHEKHKAEKRAKVAAVKGSEGNAALMLVVLPSLNEVIDLHAKRVQVGMRSRIPITIWCGLFALTVGGMASMGYQAGTAILLDRGNLCPNSPRSGPLARVKQLDLLSSSRQIR